MDSLRVAINRLGNGILDLRYTMLGKLDRIRIPEPREARFTDDLWRHTCFEMFVREASSDTYRELNFSPSGEWAAYAFDGYRSGMRKLPGPEPRMSVQRSPSKLELDVVVQIGTSPFSLGLSAVVEDVDGAISYWALKHPSEKPDFHHADAFALRLE